jgi:hypothetical protein
MLIEANVAVASEKEMNGTEVMSEGELPTVLVWPCPSCPLPLDRQQRALWLLNSPQIDDCLPEICVAVIVG